MKQRKWSNTHLKPYLPLQLFHGCGIVKGIVPSAVTGLDMKIGGIVDQMCIRDRDIETNEQGRRLLEQYGYWGNKGNAFYSQFRHQVMVDVYKRQIMIYLIMSHSRQQKDTTDQSSL